MHQPELSLPATMKAVVTTGPGGFDRLLYTDIATPDPGPGDVLIRVRAAGLNNTDINTRIGWYAPAITGGTQVVATDTNGQPGGWSGATPFPLIQGVDCCGEVVKLGSGADDALLSRRVLLRPCMRVRGFDHPDTRWLGVDFNGAFAQYVVVPASEVFPVACDWSDAELASLPCAYGTAEAMLHRANVGRHDCVVVPGASGGVASAVVQLARRRGARVIALTSPSKQAAVAALGADRVLASTDDIASALADEIVDVVIDNVGGAAFALWLKVLRRGGRYVTSGAIAGPMVPLDLRDLYLKDLTLIGSTAWDAPVFPSLIAAVEAGEIRPVVAAVFPLEEIATAQAAFLEKRHVGKIVLTPPA